MRASSDAPLGAVLRRVRQHAGRSQARCLAPHALNPESDVGFVGMLSAGLGGSNPH